MHKHTFYSMKEYYNYLLNSTDNDDLDDFYLHAAVITIICQVPCSLSSPVGIASPSMLLNIFYHFGESF